MFRKKLSETQETFELSSSLNPMLIQPGLEVQIIRVQPHKLSDLKLFNLKVSLRSPWDTVRAGQSPKPA